MGRNSGGVRNPYKSNGKLIAVTSAGKRLSANEIQQVLKSAVPLSSLPDKKVAQQIFRGISRFEAVVGVREQTIMLADTGKSYGLTFLGRDGSMGIYLNRSFFSGKRVDVESNYKKENYNGWKNVTNRPIQHTITHELAHSLWSSNYMTPKHKAAGMEIERLFNKYKGYNHGKLKGWGRYSLKNSDEFFAEAITKHIHGNKDKFTKKAFEIAKKYKL